jgi:hypothetical protein
LRDINLRKATQRGIGLGLGEARCHGRALGLGRTAAGARTMSADTVAVMSWAVAEARGGGKAARIGV